METYEDLEDVKVKIEEEDIIEPVTPLLIDTNELEYYATGREESHSPECKSFTVKSELTSSNSDLDSDVESNKEKNHSYFINKTDNKHSLDIGFAEATSDNLPEVNIFMMSTFFQSLAKNENLQKDKATKEKFGDDTIGLVQVQRDSSICRVKAKIFLAGVEAQPKLCDVNIKINEEDQFIVSLYCDQCCKQGCNHALSFLSWLHRRSEEPESSECESYWTKPFLGSIGTHKGFVTVEDFLTEKDNKLSKELQKELPDSKGFLQAFITHAKEKNLVTPLTRYFYDAGPDRFKALSLWTNILEFKREKGTEPHRFIFHISQKLKLNKKLCKEVELETRGKKGSTLWLEMRYARITASKLYHTTQETQSKLKEVAEHILSGEKLKLKEALTCETKIKKEILTMLKEPKEFTGVSLNWEYPTFICYPDYITKDYIVIIKCPKTKEDLDKYIWKGKPTDSLRAQVQLTMLMTKTGKALIAVADTDFETNNLFAIVWEDFAPSYIMGIVKKALEFWKNYIFPQLLPQ